MRHAKIFAAEFIGTMLLFVVGLNAVFNDGISTPIGLALSVGVTVVAISAIMGPVSGAHINPAVTIGLAIMRKVDPDKVLTYLVAQFLGGLAGGLIAFWIARGREGGFSPDEGNFAISGWEQLGGGYDWVTMALTVSILTGVVVLTYVAVASRGEPRAGSSLAVGLAYVAAVYAGLEMVRYRDQPGPVVRCRRVRGWRRFRAGVAGHAVRCDRSRSRRHDVPGRRGRVPRGHDAR